MKELKRMNWHEWIETNELTWVNRNEWLDMTDLKRLTRNEEIETNELNWMNELTWMNWNTKTESNELKWMICRPHLQKEEKPLSFYVFLCEIELSLHSRAHFVDLNFKKRTKKLQVFYVFYWSTTWWRCGRQMQRRSRYSHARTLSTSLSTLSSKRGNKTVIFF